VAYLVMEYLDGCTLTRVLIEENRLPLYWVVDNSRSKYAQQCMSHRKGLFTEDSETR